MIYKITILFVIYLISPVSLAGYNGDIGYTGNAYSRQVKTSAFEKLLQKQYNSNSMKNARYWSQNSAAVGSAAAGMKALLKIPIQQGVDLFAASVGMITKPSLAGAALLARKAVPIAGYIALADWFLSAGVEYNDETQQFEETIVTQFPTRRFKQTSSQYAPCYSWSDNCTVEQVYAAAINHWNNFYPGSAPFTPKEPEPGACNSASTPIGNCSIRLISKYGVCCNSWSASSGSIVNPHEPTISPISESTALQRLAESPLRSNQSDDAPAFDSVLDDLDKANQIPEPDSIEMSGPTELQHPGYPKTETHPDKVIETDKKNTITYQGDTITISPTITTQTTIFNDNSTELITTEEALPEPESEEEEKEDKDPCEDFPERVSCWEAGETPQVGPIPETEQEVTYTPVSVGTAGNCPSDISINLSFATVNFPLSHICNFATAVKPFFIIMASLTALGIVFSSVRD